MAGDYDTDVLDSDDALDASGEYDTYDAEEVDHMLDSLMQEDQDLAERRRHRNRGGRGARGVRTATGRSPYQEPAESGVVTQKQFKEAMTRVGDETRRNAEGIKTVNARVGILNGRVSDVVAVTKVHSRRIGTIDSRMKIDGALDFASSLSLNADGTALNLDPLQMLRGAVKNGVLGEPKGALANPWVVGGIALMLKNPGILGGILARP